MPKLPRDIITQEYRLHTYEKKGTFGSRMNSTYNLKDDTLSDELDDNMSLLILLKYHLHDGDR